MLPATRQLVSRRAGAALRAVLARASAYESSVLVAPTAAPISSRDAATVIVATNSRSFTTSLPRTLRQSRQAWASPSARAGVASRSVLATRTAQVQVRAFSSGAEIPPPAGVSYIRLPALSPTMESGSVAVWHKKEGDKVSPGDVIADIQTDKASVAFEAQEEFIMAAILVPAGTEGLAVGQPIGLSVEEAEDLVKAKEFAAKLSSGTGATSAPSAPAPAQQQAPATPVAASPDAPSSAVTHNLSFSPAVAFALAYYKVDPASIQGTGPKGRLLKGDVLNAVAAGTARPATGTAVSHQAVVAPASVAPKSVAPGAAQTKPAAAAASKHSAAAPAVPGLSARRQAARKVADVPLSDTQIAFAQSYSAGKRAAPHSYFQAEADVANLQAMFKNDFAKFNAFLVRAGAAAVAAKAPQVASESVVNAAIYGATAQSVITPVYVSAANHKTASQIAGLLEKEGQSATSITDAAVNVTLLSNSPVSFGSDTLNGSAKVSFTFAPPHTKAVLRDDGSIAMNSVVLVSATFNCAEVTELECAECIQALKQYIEDPATLLL